MNRPGFGPKDNLPITTDVNVMGGLGFDASVIECPLCKDGFNHIKGTATISGDDGYKAGWWGRGDLTVISMECESGHKWEFCLGFHKGNVYMFGRKAKRTRAKKANSQSDVTQS